MDLTVEVASIYMALWDLSFLNKLKQLGIRVSLYVRYVDDIVICLPRITKGWRYDVKKKELVFSLEHPYSDMEDDLRSFSVLKDIADTLDSDIKMSVDVPSLHESRRVPVLDLEVFIDEDNFIQHSFYKKTISNPRVNLYTSAISAKSKRDSLL